MSINLPLIRQMLMAIEEKPRSLRAFAESKPKGEAGGIEKLLRLLENARLVEYHRSAFSEYLRLTDSDQDLLSRMMNEGVYLRVKEEIEGGSEIDLAELKARFAISKVAAKATDKSLSEPGPPVSRSATVRRPRIFLVHGHDAEAREQVTLFLEKIGFDVVALDEQHNAGKTVIEKFEDNTDVTFALVLLTEDDVGGKRADDLRPRPRQNVIFELGFFIGRLKRERVCALRRGDVELPSDISGMVWLSFDGRWKRDLANELEKAGYPIEWRKLVE
jgi:predicted nucleotide-binding protein